MGPPEGAYASTPLYFAADAHPHVATPARCLRPDLRHRRLRAVAFVDHLEAAGLPFAGGANRSDDRGSYDPDVDERDVGRAKRDSPARGSSAYDSLHRRLFWLVGAVGSQKLVVANLNSGTATTFSIASPDDYRFIEYDPVTDRLLSVTSAAGSPLVAINPIDGSRQTLFATNAPATGVSAFDPATRRLFYLNSAAFGLNQSIVTVNLTTSVATGQPIFRNSFYLFFEYDPVTQRVLSVVSEPGMPVVSIDPAGGPVQTLFNTGAPTSFGALSAIDVTGRRLYFQIGDLDNQSLITADLAHSSSSSVSIAESNLLYMTLDFESAASITAAPAIGTIDLIVLAGALAVIALMATGSGRM